jgi:ketosteroid isomerase-like protein
VTLLEPALCSSGRPNGCRTSLHSRNDIYRGRDAIEQMWREVLRDVPDFRIDFVRVVADSPELAVVEVEFRGTGKASGAAIRASVFQAVAFRDSKVTRVEGFRSAGEALEAVGLRE